MGFVDFAGSAIVHGAGAAAALAGVLLLGARKGKYGKNGEIYTSLVLTTTCHTRHINPLDGGWFGFNGGSSCLFLTLKMQQQWVKSS